MKLFTISLLLWGLTTAAPAPSAAPSSYDRRQPARKGEPPVNIARRDEAAAVIAPTATKPTLVLTATASAKYFVATNPTAPINTAPIVTGTGIKARAVLTSTGTGTAASLATAAAVHLDVKSSYNFPSPTNVARRDAEKVSSHAHWWLKDDE